MNLEVQEHEERHAALMAVAHALTADERASLLGNAVRRYPGLDGAEVADVLDLTTDHDKFLDVTEPFLERYSDQLPQDVRLNAAMHAIVLLGLKLTPGRLVSLLQRAGLAEAPRYPEVEVGLRAYEREEPADASVTDANSVMLRARAEQGLRAAGVPESEITEFRDSVRETGIPGEQFNVGDIAAWVTFADRYTPTPRKVYDPIDDITAVLAWVVVPQQANERTLVERSEQGIKNLRSHLDMRAPETIEASLRAFFGREA
jgi:hypothetical protein